MSTITSGVGLASGLPTAELIDSIMAAAEAPRTLLVSRVSTLQTQQSALLDLNARVVALMNSISRLDDSDFFNRFSATSSDDSVLTATASSFARPGAINLTVKSLVTSHQLVSSGFPDSNKSPVGSGTMVIEIGKGKLNNPTALGDLNGGAGVRRGTIEITDKAGRSGKIDLTAVVDVEEVLQLINTSADIDVKAYVEGGHIVLEDTSGGTGDLKVVDTGNGSAALDLGILTSTAEDRIVGRDIVYLTDSTLLSSLNDGNGVRTTGHGDDFRVSTKAGISFDVSLTGSLEDTTRLDVLNHGNGVRLGVIRITNRLGNTGTVDLTQAKTIGDVREAIANAVDDSGESLEVEASVLAISGVGSISIRDNTQPSGSTEQSLIIEDVSGHAAVDLGIAKEEASGSFVGSGIHSVTTIGDVVRAINYAQGNDGAVVASLTSTGIHLQDESGLGKDAFIIEPLGDSNPSQAAYDLGIAGTHDGQPAAVTSPDLIAGLNTVLLRSLNGGSGLDVGVISIAASDGSPAVQVDLTDSQTLQDIISKINEAVPGVKASVNAVGNGISITDTTGGAGTLVISDVSGTTAADLGLQGSHKVPTVDGVNLQLQYINEMTELDGLNGGRGVASGKIKVQTTTGQILSIEIDEGDQTIGDVIDTINAAGKDYGISADINASGDGIVIRDSNEGTGKLVVSDQGGGTAAADLRIAGESTAGEAIIDGSYEIRIDIDAGDTLKDVADKINEASPDLNASVLNDGASTLSYRLSVTSGVTGKAGELIFDGGSTGLNMNTLVAAQDAVALIGGKGTTSPIVVSSSSNTLTDVIPGVEVDLQGVSEDPVSLTVSQDVDHIVSDLESFVSAYNSVIDRIDELTSFDEESYERGPLLGDSSVLTVESRLSRMLLQRFDHAPAGLQTLGSVGLTIGDGGHLSFDSDKFREKYTENPQGVEELFAAEEVGVAAVFEEILDSLADDENGVLTQRNEILGNQVEDLNDRIESMEDRLALQRERLERQYANLETVISGLQEQQTALTQLAALAGQ